MDANELFINWAKGEWKLGEDPRPLPPKCCLSAERYYNAPNIYQEDRFEGISVQWEHHALVDKFVKQQPVVVKKVLVLEYIERYHRYYGLTRTERIEIIARRLRLNQQTIRGIIKRSQGSLMAYIRGKI